VLLASLAPGASARGQALASPFGTVTQRIDSTTISVEYYRPSMRGRAIFGSLVRWGVLWTPGANWGTTLQVNHDVTFGGQPLPAGKYTLWMIPGPREWIVTVSRAVPRFHMLRPGPSDEQLRFTVAADSAPPLEMLTFTFPEVTPDGTTLRFQWAGTVVSMPIRVHGGAAAPAAAHPLGSYAGVYAIRDAEDTAAAAGRYEITLEGTRLRVRTDPQWVEEGLDPEFDLVAAGGDGFHARQYKNGVVVGTEADELITFRFEDGRVVGFEIRGMAENRVLARAVLACPGGRCG
jgi:hypothetical protein